ncbi:MAG: hypothetical protein HZB56_12130 [Deltaproteobacteria bacterium]|nr:hypothetical protein [Deltaproteobacteria bacterium]
MAARPYRPSGLGDSGSTATLLVGCLAVGGVAGLAASLVVPELRLFPFFPLLLGLAVGLFGRWAVGRFRVRAPLRAALLAAAGGLSGVLALHLADGAALLPAPVRSRPAPADTGQPRPRPDPGGRRPAGTWGLVLWGLEALVAAGSAGSLAWGRARMPFCERCKRWYQPEVRVAVGSGAEASVRAAAAALDRRDMPAVAAALGAPDEEAAAVLALARCSRCLSHHPLVSYRRHTRLKRGQRSALRYHSLLRPEEAEALLAAVGWRPAGEEPTAPSG